MLYPLKFEPLYKDYIWGGRNLGKLGKKLPEGIVAESWEVAAHPDGMSRVSNGRLKGMTLQDLFVNMKTELCGRALFNSERFPLLLKLIDASNDLSIQVHPDDKYAAIHEDGEWGKNEAWYIISAEPGAHLVYDVVPGTRKEDFEQAIKSESLEACLQKVPVQAGDVIYIPAGVVHAICKGIVLAEIQQNSNATYRVYDYGRIDDKGRKRPLHVDKALDVTDFASDKRKSKFSGLSLPLNKNGYKKYLVANRYFCMELCEIDGTINENTYQDRFFIYLFLEGSATIRYSGGVTEVLKGESVLLPASLGEYSVSGKFKALRCYVPDIKNNVVAPLISAGYDINEIFCNVAGISQEIAE
jgi:mannose-6-phosphate isomerase